MRLGQWDTIMKKGLVIMSILLVWINALWSEGSMSLSIGNLKKSNTVEVNELNGFSSCTFLKVHFKVHFLTSPENKNHSKIISRYVLKKVQIFFSKNAPNFGIQTSKTVSLRSIMHFKISPFIFQLFFGSLGSHWNSISIVCWVLHF